MLIILDYSNPSLEHAKSILKEYLRKKSNASGFFPLSSNYFHDFNGFFCWLELNIVRESRYLERIILETLSSQKDPGLTLASMLTSKEHRISAKKICQLSRGLYAQLLHAGASLESIGAVELNSKAHKIYEAGRLLSNFPQCAGPLSPVAVFVQNPSLLVDNSETVNIILDAGIYILQEHLDSSGKQKSIKSVIFELIKLRETDSSDNSNPVLRNNKVEEINFKITILLSTMFMLERNSRKGICQVESAEKEAQTSKASRFDEKVFRAAQYLGYGYGSWNLMDTAIMCILLNASLSIRRNYNKNESIENIIERIEDRLREISSRAAHLLNTITCRSENDTDKIVEQLMCLTEQSIKLITKKREFQQYIEILKIADFIQKGLVEIDLELSLIGRDPKEQETVPEKNKSLICFHSESGKSSPSLPIVERQGTSNSVRWSEGSVTIALEYS